MGLFAPPAAYLAGRLGTRVAIGACLAGIAGFGLIRAAAPGAPPVLALTFPIGLGMGLAGALMPVAVKERFADRPAFASGVYTTGIQVGSTLSSALAVPIAAAWGGWRSALAVFSASTILLFAAWMLLTPPSRDHERAAPPRLPWRRGLVWGLVVVFALQSTVYYGLVAWMPDSFQERGWSEEAAGALLAVMSLAAVPSGLLLPFFADRIGSRRQWLGLTSSVILVAAIGVAALPDAGFAWAVLAGSGIGAMFPLTLTLPVDIAHEPAGTGAVVGLMLGAGYTIAAVGPILLGAVRDATGSFATSLWLLVALAAALVAAILPLSPRRLRPPARLPAEALAP
jgi:CP family cyanate transporter-like MFS transporter